MTRCLLAVLVAGSLASGCTIALPAITAGVQGPEHDAETAKRHHANQLGALFAGLAIDTVLVFAGLDFADKLEHSGD
jgi:hypothetical protein